MIAVIAAASFLSLSPAQWDSTTKAAEAAYQAANIIDMGQTRYVAQHPESYREIDSAWILGSHPEPGDVIIFGIVSAVGHAFITDKLVQYGAPKLVLRAWQALTLGDKVAAVAQNYSIGIKVSFK